MIVGHSEHPQRRDDVVGVVDRGVQVVARTGIVVHADHNRPCAGLLRALRADVAVGDGRGRRYRTGGLALEPARRGLYDRFAVLARRRRRLHRCERGEFPVRRHRINRRQGHLLGETLIGRLVRDDAPGLRVTGERAATDNGDDEGDHCRDGQAVPDSHHVWVTAFGLLEGSGRPDGPSAARTMM